MDSRENPCSYHFMCLINFSSLKSVDNTHTRHTFLVRKGKNNLLCCHGELEIHLSNISLIQKNLLFNWISLV
jgi:hypothetical protein